MENPAPVDEQRQDGGLNTPATAALDAPPKPGGAPEQRQDGLALTPEQVAWITSTCRDAQGMAPDTPDDRDLPTLVVDTCSILSRLRTQAAQQATLEDRVKAVSWNASGAAVGKRDAVLLGLTLLGELVQAVKASTEASLVLPDAQGAVLGPTHVVRDLARTMQTALDRRGAPPPAVSAHALSQIASALGDALPQLLEAVKVGGQAEPSSPAAAPAPEEPRHKPGYVGPVTLTFPSLTIRDVWNLLSTGAQLIDPPTLTAGPGMDLGQRLEAVTLTWETIEEDGLVSLQRELAGSLAPS